MKQRRRQHPDRAKYDRLLELSRARRLLARPVWICPFDGYKNGPQAELLRLLRAAKGRAMMLHGIWCKDIGFKRNGENKADWLRERNTDRYKPILAFESKRAACKRAAEEYGYPSYTEAKRKGWVEVRPLCGEAR